MDKIEAVARAYCREMGLDPDEPVSDQVSYSEAQKGNYSVYDGHGYYIDQPLWQRYADEASSQLAWAAAIKSVETGNWQIMDRIKDGPEGPFIDTRDPDMRWWKLYYIYDGDPLGPRPSIPAQYLSEHREKCMVIWRKANGVRPPELGPYDVYLDADGKSVEGGE